MTGPAVGDEIERERHPDRRGIPRVSSLTAVAAGTLGVALAVGIVLPLGEGSSRIIHTVLLIIPVIVAGLLGGRAAAVAVSTEAAIAFSFFLEPFGSPRVSGHSELAALAVFVVLAATTGVLVSNVVNAERRRAAAEHEALEALERTEAQRKALLRSVSHDLRTPLGTILGATEELADEVGHDAASRRELLSMVVAETLRLDRIVANMLSLGRVEAGALLPERQPVDLEDLVRSSTRRLESILSTRTVELEVHGAVPLVDVDPSQIDQVVTNVIENAVRHSPPRTTITIDLRTIGTEIELVVADDGPGFPPGSEDKVFEPFALATGAGSSGIGLAICRSIVEAHRGTISVQNRATGGAQVTVVLPIHG